MGFFNKPQEVAEALEPLSVDRIKAILDSRGDHYGVDSDGDVGGFWDGCLYFFLLPNEQRTLQIRGRWWGTFAPTQFPEVVSACNEWTTERYWPKVYAQAGEDEQLRVFVEHNVDFEQGATDAQLEQQLRCGLGTGGQFFDFMNERFPEEAAAGKAEFESE